MGSNRFRFQNGIYLPEFLGAFGNEAQCDSLIGGRARDGRFRCRAATGWHAVVIGPGNPHPPGTDVPKSGTAETARVKRIVAFLMRIKPRMALGRLELCALKRPFPFSDTGKGSFSNHQSSSCVSQQNATTKMTRAKASTATGQGTR